MNEFVRKFESAEQPWSPEEFEARLRAVGPERYHDKHEFHKLFALCRAQDLANDLGFSEQSARAHEPIAPSDSIARGRAEGFPLESSVRAFAQMVTS